MSDTLKTIHGVQVLICAPEGEKLRSEQNAVELIGETFQQGVEWIIVPVERLEDDFFQLKTRLAGHFIQKFVTYRRHLVILGDISGYIAQSRAFNDYVYETNRGNDVWFLPNMQALEDRLKRIQQG
ncbi:DUF4180 domain-containing protein [Ktedonobacter robiniae]|uniref:DUF4180 domain-containing protein n=1 Tax=Ktedonobacter robiniae TaxID=2778365 RepID=A0ABQ3UVL3_9CHLR|nr:DUF4180 domain-containing protein [Ktedonobacter robiniae]GHO56856.1 hypothetical protein KSB_53310 [Ktedonobacter robiniae]